MDLLDQAFDAAMDKTHPEMTAEQREKYKSVIERIFKDNLEPHEAMGLSDEMLENLYAYGNTLFNTGNYQKAQQVYLALCYLKPTHSKFMLALASTYHKMKDYPNATFGYVHSASLDKDNPLPLFYLYDCFMQQNLFPSALEALIEAIKRCGSNKEHARLKAKCLMIIKSLQKQVDEVMKETQSEEPAKKPESQTAENTKVA